MLTLVAFNIVLGDNTTVSGTLNKRNVKTTFISNFLFFKLTYMN